MENSIPDIIDSYLSEAIKNQKLSDVKSISMNLVTVTSLTLSECKLVNKISNKITYRGFDVKVDYDMDNNQIRINYK